MKSKTLRGMRTAAEWKSVAKVTGALEYDLIGEICDEPAQ